MINFKLNFLMVHWWMLNSLRSNTLIIKKKKKKIENRKKSIVRLQVPDCNFSKHFHLKKKNGINCKQGNEWERSKAESVRSSGWGDETDGNVYLFDESRLHWKNKQINQCVGFLLKISSKWFERARSIIDSL